MAARILQQRHQRTPVNMRKPWEFMGIAIALASRLRPRAELAADVAPPAPATSRASPPPLVSRLAGGSRDHLACPGSIQDGGGGHGRCGTGWRALRRTQLHRLAGGGR